MTIKINGTNTTAQPSITGTDTDTGLVYGTDEVSIVTGGTDRVKVDGSGILLVNAAAAGSKSSNAPLNVVSGSGGWGQTLRNRSNNDYAFQAFNSHDNSEQLASIALQRTGTNSGDLFFSTNGGNASATERMRILSSGGLTFNGDTATANALDDYEEGTWTPVINVGTALISNSHYIKIGNIVHLSAIVQNFSNTTSTTLIQVSGIPFFRKSLTQGVATTFYRYIDVGSHTQLVALMGSDRISFYAMNPGTGANYAELDYQHFTQTNSQLRFSMTYITD